MSEKSLRLEILEKIFQLATAGFGLVAALAWNDAIQEMFKEIFGTQSTILAKFIYALLITVLVVLITYKMGNVVNRLKEQISQVNSKDNDQGL